MSPADIPDAPDWPQSQDVPPSPGDRGSGDPREDPRHDPRDDPTAGPADTASVRAKRSGQREPHERSHPLPLRPDEPSGDSAVLGATRALLRASSRREAAWVLHTTVHDLGGSVVPARLAGPDALPVDVSLGVGEPHLVVVEPVSMAALRLSQHLPFLVEDALITAARSDLLARQARHVAVDALTGVATRSEIGARLGRTAAGDIVCLLDLDGFKKLNDSRGHAAGDGALRDFGGLLRNSVRGTDFCGRYGGDEFVVVLDAIPMSVACERMSQMAGAWSRQGDHGTSVSIGMAVVDQRGSPAATAAADRAMYRAKRQGRGRLQVAGAADYES